MSFPPTMRKGMTVLTDGIVSLPASFSVWLASPEARFLNRKYLWVNWDVDELKARAKEIEEGQEFNIQVVGWPFGEKKWSSAVNFSSSSEV